MGKSKTERIDRLEKMLQGSNGEMHTYEPYQGVFADLEEHHSRLKAVEHDVPGLAGEIDLLLRRVIKLEQATDPKVKLNVLQRMVKEALAQRDEARARIKELEEERELLRDKIDRLETEAIDRDRTYKASLLSKNTVGGEDVSFWHRRYWDLDQRIVRFRNGYTSFGSPERHELDRILDQADRSLSVEEEE